MTVRKSRVDRRRTVRSVATGLAGLTALLYYLIGFQVVTVLENPEDQAVFGMIAGTAFLAGALVIWFFDRRVLMGLGAVAQALIILMYFNLAPEREPSYEPWGIAIRVVQVSLFAALTYLAVRPVAPPSPAVEREVERTASSA
jgi:hypothetical protein